MNFEKIESYELTGNNMKQILGDDIKIISYPDLKNFTDIMQCFDTLGRCVLFLIENEQGNTMNGHYQCLIYHDDTNTIEFFDSYGMTPTGWNKYISKSIQQKLHEISGTLLVPLLKKAKSNGYKVIYNDKKLQQMKNDINTCGDFVSTRLLFHNLSIYNYIKMLDNLKTHYDVDNYDKVVSEYVYNIIGK